MEQHDRQRQEARAPASARISAFGLSFVAHRSTLKLEFNAVAEAAVAREIQISPLASGLSACMIGLLT